MALRSDAFEILRDCRALFLKHLGALLLDGSVVSGQAIRAIQEGAGAYFDEMVSTSRRGSFAEEANGLTSSRITLVGEDDLELGIRLDNLSARLFETTGGALWRIHLRFVTLLRRPDLPKSDNPVGPKGIGEGLMAMFAAAGASSIEQKLDLLDRIEGCLRDGLPALYAEINDFLDRGGVASAQPAIVTAQDGNPQKAKAAQTGRHENPLLALQQALASRLPAGSTMPPQEQGAGGAAASLLSQAMLERLIFRLDELDRHNTLAPNFRPGTAPTTESLIPELFSGSDKPAASGVLKAAELGIPGTASEGLAIDTLALIFEAIFKDPKLPDALKAAISSLQITLLKVAMKDAALFTNSQHPARQVLDRMGHAVLGLPGDVPARHPICARLFEIATQLRSTHGRDPEAFEKACNELDALIAQRNSELTRAVAPYLPLLHQLDRRDGATTRTRQVIDKLIGRQPPEAIRTFLEQSWFKVLQQVWLEHGPESSQWQSHVAAVDDLLWTFQPKTDPEERKALARRLPEMLKLLKAGMERIGLSGETQEAFLDTCFMLQTQALRAASPAAANDKDDGTGIAATGLHLTDQDAVLGDIRSGQLVLNTLDFPDFQPAPTRSLPCVVGDWLELQFAGETHVARICHVSPDSLRHLLVNPEGDFFLAIHPAILDRILWAGEAHIVTSTSLFETAAGLALQKTGGPAATAV